MRSSAGTLELALGNLQFLARSVRVIPDTRDGKPFGFRLFAIRADGPAALLGLRNDDVLVSINGLDIATPDHVLDAYGKLKTAPHLVLGLIRAETRDHPGLHDSVVSSVVIMEPAVALSVSLATLVGSASSRFFLGTYSPGNDTSECRSHRIHNHRSALRQD
jgi:membrane-associated protease RseP (regulator of RpoE activity)